MKSGRGMSFSSVIDDDERNAREYLHALRGVSRLSSLILFVYPFLLVFLVAFFIGDVYVLASIFAIYWLGFFYLESRRYSVDVRMRGISVDFRNYVIHSPFSQNYFKFSVLPMLIFFGELIGYYVRMTAFEGATLIVVVLAILVAALYINPWLRGQLKNARTLESDYINSKLQDVALNERVTKVQPVVIDGKTYKVANAYTVGTFRPVICITDYALDNLSEDENVAILTHELSHFKRKDVLRMAVPAFTATVSVMVMVAIVAYWSTEPGMIPFLQKIMPSMVQAWVLIAMAGLLFLPSIIRWRGEFKADKLAAEYSGADRTVDALVKLQHLNRLPVYVLPTRRTSLLLRINRIRKYQR